MDLTYIITSVMLLDLAISFNKSFMKKIGLALSFNMLIKSKSHIKRRVSKPLFAKKEGHIF